MNYEAATGRRAASAVADAGESVPGRGAIPANPAITIVENNIRNSASTQWNFTLERELVSNIGFRASYVGNRASHLPFYNYNINLPAQQRLGTIQA